jgi:putative Mg2+ transporter-C (MgtC) family protein
MNQLSFESLSVFWSAPEIATNFIVFLNLAGAVVLGLIVGYERTFHGRAAGMRTYALVCVASTAVTVITGYTSYWHGGHGPVIGTTADATRVIQGILTGVGFIGAGVIMKDGFNISGLTTAASIWVSSVIGIMVGVGFYGAAMLLTLLSVTCMMWVAKLEMWLPIHTAIAIHMRFKSNYVPHKKLLSDSMTELGYDIAWGSLAISYLDAVPEWKFVAVSKGKTQGTHLTEIAEMLASFVEIDRFSLSYARN